MDAAGIERAAIMRVRGRIARGVVCRIHPSDALALILYGAFARFSDWFPTKQKFDGFLNYVDTAWGTGSSIAAFAPSKKGDAEFQRWWSRFERLGGSPSAVINLMRMNSEINIDNILPSILVPRSSCTERGSDGQHQAAGSWRHIFRMPNSSSWMAPITSTGWATMPCKSPTWS